MLINGSKKYKHDGLIYELKDFYQFDNISVRKNKRSLDVTFSAPRGDVPLAGLDFGGPVLE